METIIVFVIVAAAIFGIVRTLKKQADGTSGCKCSTGCQRCSQSQPNDGDLLHPNQPENERQL